MNGNRTPATLKTSVLYGLVLCICPAPAKHSLTCHFHLHYLNFNLNINVYQPSTRGLSYWRGIDNVVNAGIECCSGMAAASKQDASCYYMFRQSHLSWGIIDMQLPEVFISCYRHNRTVPDSIPPIQTPSDDNDAGGGGAK